MSGRGNQKHRAIADSERAAGSESVALPTPRTVRNNVTTAAAAVTLAAAAVLGAHAVTHQTTSSMDAGTIIGSPVNSAAARIAGIQADTARAVELKQLTAEQAAFLEAQLLKRIDA